MDLIPIREKPEENKEFINDPKCHDIVLMSIDFYKRVGYLPPWICYIVEQDGRLVGGAGIKGGPVNGKVEISYGTFDEFQNKGIGTLICRRLVEICISTDSTLRITARTLPENEPSKRILQKNNFICLGTVTDPEDGLVLEWEYKPDYTHAFGRQSHRPIHTTD